MCAFNQSPSLPFLHRNSFDLATFSLPPSTRPGIGSRTRRKDEDAQSNRPIPILFNTVSSYSERERRLLHSYPHWQHANATSTAPARRRRPWRRLFVWMLPRPQQLSTAHQFRRQLCSFSSGKPKNVPASTLNSQCPPIFKEGSMGNLSYITIQSLLFRSSSLLVPFPLNKCRSNRSRQFWIHASEIIDTRLLCHSSRIRSQSNHHQSSFPATIAIFFPFDLDFQALHVFVLHNTTTHNTPQHIQACVVVLTSH